MNLMTVPDDNEKSDGAEQTAPSTEGHSGVESETASTKNTNRNAEEVTPKKGDIFDDLAALGRPLDEVLPSEKVLTSLPVRKPKRDEWVRLHPEIHARVYVYESENSWYVVLPDVIEPLLDVVRYVEISLAVNYSGTPFAWPVPVPTESKPHRAHLTAFGGAEQARREWIRISWGDGEYDIYRRKSAKVDPKWPAEIGSASEMLRFASKAGGFEVIDSMDHPVVRGLLGRD
jgi:hypothetical protein